MTRHALLTRLVSLITAIDNGSPVRVAIDGVDGAGKTTLADELVDPIEHCGRPVIRASVDGFHNPRALRYRKGVDSPEGFYHDSYNYPLLVETLLNPVGPGGSRRCRTALFDHRVDAPVGSPLLHVVENAILLLDGIFLHRPELRGFWDFSIFLRVDFDVTLERLLQRDAMPEGGIDEDARRECVRRWQRRYMAGQNLYLREADPERWASIVVVNDRPEDPVIA